MIKVAIVGDAPSKLNVDEDVPFVGAACFERLISWIKVLSPDFYLCFNSESHQDRRSIETLALNGFKVIALGKFASVRLNDYGVPHFTLPHPSGRNVKNNNKELIEAALVQAKEYING